MLCRKAGGNFFSCIFVAIPILCASLLVPLRRPFKVCSNQKNIWENYLLQVQNYFYTNVTISFCRFSMNVIQIDAEQRVAA